MTVIGSAYVNIRAITDKLESDIRKALDSIKDSVTLTVDADVSSATKKLDELSSSHLADQTLSVSADTTSAQAALDDLANTVLGDQTITVHADTSEAVRDLESITNLSHLQDQTVHINVSADPTQAIIDLHTIAAQSIDVDVVANTLAAQRRVDNMLDDIGHSHPVITPIANTALTEAQLRVATRMRNVRINIITNTAPLKTLGGYLARLSGLRVAATSAHDLVEEFSNIDKAVPGIALMATKMATIGGAAISAVGGVFTLGASLASLIQMIGFAAPGMIAGFVVGMGTLIVALKDFGKQLPDVVAGYKGLAAVIQQNFWSVAREPIRDMAMTLLPLFKKGLAETATSLGGWATTFAGAMKQSLTPDTLAFMFGNLAKSIDIASNANGPFIGAMVELGKVGSALLPRLAQWWVDVANKFQNFINGAVSSGEMAVWVEQGITVLKQLGRVISDVAHIFSEITGAAQLAGSDGLGSIVKGLDKIREALNSPEGARALITIFEGAAAVTGPLLDGIGKIFGALGNASPAIKSAFESTGGVITQLADAISQIISNPEFQAGFAALFDGIQKGADALLPVLATTGPKIGALLSIIGSLAANIGGILGAALQVALPFITEFKKAIDPLIPILGDALIRVIQALAPTFQMLADTISQLAPVITPVIKVVAELIAGLVEQLGPALPGIIATLGALFLGFQAFRVATTVVSGLTTAFSGLMGIGQLLVGLSKNYGILKFAIEGVAAGMNILKVAFLANPVGIVIGAIVALVAGFVLAYNNIGWFKDGVDAAMKWIGEAIGNLVSFWNTDVVPMWNNAMQAAGDFFGAIGAWVGDAIKNIQDFFGGFGKGAGDAQASVGGFFDGIGAAFSDFFGGIGDWFAGIGKGIGDAFNGAVEFVSGILGAIGAVISVGVNNIVTNWTNAFNFVADIFTNVWNGLVWFFQPLVDLIVAIIRGATDIIVAIWTAVWEIIATIFYGIWINLVRFFEPILQGLVDFITNTVNGVVAVWNAVWQAIGDFFIMIWNNMVAFYGPILQGIWDFIVAVGAGISAAWNAAWQAIGDFFTTIWNNMVAFYGPILQSIWDFIVAVGAGIAATWNAIWSGISSFFTGIWNAIVGFVQGAVQSVSNVVTNTVNGISAAWNATWSAISGYVSSVWSGIVTAVSGFVGEVQRKVQDVLNTVGRIGSDIVSNVSNFGTLLLNSGRDLINGLTQGIQNASGAVVEKIKEIAGGALDAIKDFFGIKSPSRVMRDQVGKQLGLGLAIGIEASIGAVLKATDKLAAAAVPDIADIMLPAVKTASGASQRVSTVATTAPALTRASVTGSTSNSTTGTGVFGQQSNVAPVVNFNVQTTPGLNEVQVGEHAMNYMYWKLSSSTPL